MKKSIAMHLLSALASGFGGLNSSTITSAKASAEDSFLGSLPKGGKGQLRQAKPKSSGAAQLKREAKKRNNIRKHK